MEFFFVKLKSIFFPKEEESRRKKKCISSYIECIFLLHLSIRIFRSIAIWMMDRIQILKKIGIAWKPGLYMIGYRIWKNILKFLPFCQSIQVRFIFYLNFPLLKLLIQYLKRRRFQNNCSYSVTQLRNWQVDLD